MDIEQLRHYCLNKKAATETFPFDDSTLVFKVLGKMFVIAPLDKWDKGEASITIKCEPALEYSGYTQRGIKTPVYIRIDRPLL